MRIEFTKAARADGVDYAKGDDATIRDATAQKLIARGYAKKWTTKKIVKKEAEDGPSDS